ncbi:glycosyltransferase family 4 protein [Opitutaceae bacterium]|nr:glycosyltransferase family 4 protein [Opitutaceae bacterium]
MISTELEVLHGLETPYPLQPSQNYVRLEGWAFLRGQSARSRVRFRVGTEVFEPTEKPAREDVAQQFPDEPHALTSGFVFVCFLPFGTHAGVLEVSGDDHNHWVAVRNPIIPVSSHPLMGQFEPAGSDGMIIAPIRLAGWCWHPEFRIKEVAVLMGNIMVPVDFGLERPDVETRFPDQPSARFAGFMTKENLPRGQGRIRLRVLTDCGRTYFLDPQLEAKLKTGAYLPPLPPPRMWKVPPAESTESTTPAKTPRGFGAANILFVLFGDFTSNSAYHVTALANALIERGYDCVVAVPHHPETIEAQPEARFLAIEFSQLSNLTNFYSDNQGPAVTHVWTPRESVREFWEKIKAQFDTDLVVHLEDNETELLRNHVQLTESELQNLSPAELDDIVPASLSHPAKSQQFLGESKGVTTIIETLTSDLESSQPHITFWPAATANFNPRERNVELRRKLGIPDEDTVIFYHGNIHRANAAEMTELYQAVQQLNETGLSTWLVRTGRDSPEFSETAPEIPRNRLIHLGFVKRAKDLPIFMSMADMFVQPGSAGAFNDFRFPSKLPEFFAIGRPVILPKTNLGNQLKHLKHAYVVEDAHADAIAEALGRIKGDPSLSQQLSAGALLFAEKNFSWKLSAEKLADFYRQNTRLASPSTRRVDAMHIVNDMYH